jgi:hypothetical protein
VICVGAFIHPGLLGGTLVYIFQLCRIALARESAPSRSWTRAVFLLLAKFPEFQGILKFFWLQLRRKPATLIEYK